MLDTVLTSTPCWMAKVANVLSCPDREHLLNLFRTGLEHSLSAAGISAETANLLRGLGQSLFTKTHDHREVAFLNRPGMTRCLPN